MRPPTFPLTHGLSPSFLQEPLILTHFWANLRAPFPSQQVLTTGALWLPTRAGGLCWGSHRVRAEVGRLLRIHPGREQAVGVGEASGRGPGQPGSANRKSRGAGGQKPGR